MKYLISSNLHPKINGVYETRYGNNFLYHNTTNNKYKLYYDNDTTTWNVGILGEKALYTSGEIAGIDVFRAVWEDTSLSISSIIEDKPIDNNSFVRDRVNTLLASSRCSNCGLYVCCCDLEVDSANDDSELAKTLFQSNRGFSSRNEKGILRLENASGFYTIANGIGEIEATYRVEFRSVTNNRYGHIDFRIEKSDESRPIMLEITNQEQYYSEKSSTALATSKYLVFTHIRVIRYNNMTYKIELFYNRNAFDNSSIACKVTAKPIGNDFWPPVGFKGPNTDTDYWTCMPPLSVNTMFTKVSGKSTFMIDKEARTAIDVQKPVAKLDMFGSIRATSDNPYLLDKWRHVDKETLYENDIVILNQNSFATLNGNKGFYGSNSYDNKRLNRIRNLGEITIYFDGRKVLAQFTIGSVSGASVSCSGLNTTGVNIGDFVMTRYSVGTPVTYYYDIRKVIGLDSNNNIVVESGFSQTWWDGNTNTVLNFHTAHIYHIPRHTKLTGTCTAVKDTVTGSGTLFTSELIVGDTLIFVSPTNIFVRDLLQIQNDTTLKIDNTVGNIAINDIFLIKIPSQFVLQDKNNNPAMMVKNDGSLQLGGDLTLFGTGNGASNGIKLSVTTGKIDVLSNTMAGNNTDGQTDTYSTGTGMVDFVKLDGNLKVDGVTKFTDNIFFCSQTNDSPAKPEVTALIDTELGDIRLKGSVVSSRLVSSNASVVNLQAANVFSQTSSTWSDIRLKEDVENIARDSEILKKIDELNPVTFKWKDSGTEDVGFIGQELATIFPDVVEESVDGVLSIHYNRLLTYMVVAMKEMINKE